MMSLVGKTSRITQVLYIPLQALLVNMCYLLSSQVKYTVVYTLTSSNLIYMCDYIDYIVVIVIVIVCAYIYVISLFYKIK